MIGPWNYPLTNSFGDCIPALAAGNAVDPQAGEPDPADLAADARGAARVAACPRTSTRWSSGPGATIGSALIDEVDVVMFTGSTEVGKQVMQQAGKTVTPVSLELGGKDPMIVLADADLERAANSAVYYSMQNGGQTCISIERVYAEAPIYDEFVAKVEWKMRELRQGVSTDPGTVEVGAITSPEQGDIVEAHVADAVEKGARVLVGGKRHSERGDFFEPTLLVDVDHSMKCMTEETFGPTLPVMKVADVDEAVEASPTTRRSASSPPCSRRTSTAASRSRAGSRRASAASTTPASTTSRSSCRWAAGRNRASGRAMEPAASASTRASRPSSRRGSR